MNENNTVAHTGAQTTNSSSPATEAVDVRAPLLIEGAHTHTEPTLQKRDQGRPHVATANRLDPGYSLAQFPEEIRKERLRRAVRRAVDLEDRPPTPIPPAISLKQRFAQARPEIGYRIVGWFVIGGKVILIAQYKSGKTTLVGNFVRSVVDGVPFLGAAQVRPVNSVVILDFEMSEGQIEAWLRDQAIQNTDRVHLISLRGAAGSFDILDEGRRREWAGHLRGLSADLVIVDCLRPALDALGLDEHSEAGRWFTAFDALLKEADVPEALVVHHSGHGGDRSRGDSRILDWPDGIWSLVRAERDDLTSARFISARGRDIAVDEGHLEFEPLTRHLTYSAKSRNALNADRVMVAVLRLLAEAQNPMSIRQIKGALAGKGHSNARIEATLVKASGAAQGYVTRIKGAKGAYDHCITAAGRAFLMGDRDEAFV